MSNNGNKQKFTAPSVEEVKSPVEGQKKDVEKAEAVKETPKSEPVKTEEKKDVKSTTPEAEKTTVKAEPEAETPKVKNGKKDVTIAVGKKVTLKPNVKTVTGQPIPAFAFKNVYVVEKVLPNRVIVKAGTTLTYAVKEEDLVLI